MFSQGPAGSPILAGHPLCGPAVRDCLTGGRCFLLSVALGKIDHQWPVNDVSFGHTRCLILLIIVCCGAYW